MQLEAIAICDVGKVRQNNEDNFYLQGKVRRDLSLLRTEEYFKGPILQGVFAVADGMGGEENGEVASLVTVQSLRPCTMDEIYKDAMEHILQANEMLCDEMLVNGGKRMGSTLAALYVEGDKAVAVNIGDSRIYRIRDDVLQQLSKDHTMVQQMVDMGVITGKEARNHKKRHILSQNIGIFPEEMLIEPYFTEEFAVKAGDVFLLCSDGLTDMATDEEIRDVLRNGDIQGQAQKLVQLALSHGGKDNVTVLLVKA